MTKRVVNPKSLRGGVPSSILGSRMPARRSAPVTFLTIGDGVGRPPITTNPPRKPLNLALLGLKRG